MGITKLLLNNFLKILFMLSLLLIGSVVFAQTTEASKNEITEEHNTKQLNKLINDYNQDSKKVIDTAEKLNDPSDQAEISEKDIEESKKIKDVYIVKKSKPAPKDPSKVKYSEFVATALAPLQNLTEQQLVISLKENTRGTMAHEYVVNYPTFALYIVRLIKDKDALPTAAKILEDQQKIIRFVAVMVSTFIFGFMLKRFFRKEGRTIMQAILAWFVRFLIMLSVRLYIVYLFYDVELGPLFKIATKTFF